MLVKIVVVKLYNNNLIPKYQFIKHPAVLIPSPLLMEKGQVMVIKN